MSFLLILMLAIFVLSTLILILLAFFVRTKNERYLSNKTAKELQKLKKQII